MRIKKALQMRIVQLCGERDMSLNALARVSGITQSTLNNIINGRNNTANVATIQKICDGLEMDIADFFNCSLFRDIEQEIV